MQFCDNCQNMLYIRLQSDRPNELWYYCRCCRGEKVTKKSGAVIMDTIFNHKSNQHEYFVNRYTKYDPTLPRICNGQIVCVNEDCETNINKQQQKQTAAEIITIRYDDDNLKYLYLCTTCDTVWKQ